MCHALPPPLSPRCFPVLVLTASTSANSFIVVSITVNLNPSPTSSSPSATPPTSPSLPDAYYSTGRNITHPDPGATRRQRKKTVLGRYVAVESVKILDADETETGEAQGAREKHGETNGQIEWTMALASDARGVLPMALQNRALPGAISGDVGLFVKWIRNRDGGVNGEGK